MEEIYLQVASWLENSSYMPEEARDDVECAKENIPGSLSDFFDAFKELSQNDYHNPEVFRAHLQEIKVQVTGLRGDLQTIEDALRKTIIHGRHREFIDEDDESL